jgi:hypothetical protein
LCTLPFRATCGTRRWADANVCRSRPGLPPTQSALSHPGETAVSGHRRRRPEGRVARLVGRGRRDSGPPVAQLRVESDQPNVRPAVSAPSMMYGWPDTKAASSEASHVARLATSSGSHMRPSGCFRVSEARAVVGHVLHQAFGGQHDQDLAEWVSRHAELGGQRHLPQGPARPDLAGEDSPPQRRHAPTDLRL